MQQHHQLNHFVHASKAEAAVRLVIRSCTTESHHRVGGRQRGERQLGGGRSHPTVQTEKDEASRDVFKEVPQNAVV